MSKVLISSLIDEINALLSRPVGSVSRKASPDMIHQREQLKQLRSHLENLTDDSQIGNLDQQYQALVTRLQGHQPMEIEHLTANTQTARTDKLDTLPTLFVSPVGSNLFGDKTDLIQETSIMTNGTPESNSTFVNDRMIAALQQAIQQTLQQVVKESVQLSVQQVVSQTLAVERALMVGELSASINKIVESQQRSQISQELITLNQQKQKLSAEISQLESDRNAWMQHFQEFQSSQQESLDRSLRSVNTYLQDQIRDQITDTVQQTVQQTVTGTVHQAVAQTIQETLQDNLVNQPAIATSPAAEAQREQEFVNKVQEQTDRFLSHLDEMFSSTFRSLEQDIQEYQTSIETKLGHIETLEQKGEALINALVDRMSQQNENVAAPSMSELENILPELPDDIPPQYLETVIEPVDENLINALLAGNQFGEPIPIPIADEEIIDISPLATGVDLSQQVDTSYEDIHGELEGNLFAEELSEDVAAKDDLVNIIDSNVNESDLDELDLDELDLDELVESEQSDENNSEITEIEAILGASSDTLFEIPVETNQPLEALDAPFDEDLAIDTSSLDPNSIEDQHIANKSIHLHPDFDLEAETQIVENFDDQVTEIADVNELDLQALNLSADLSSDLPSESGVTVDDPELMQWLEESSNRPIPTTNIADISPDQELLLWLGNDAIDMAKLPTQPQKQIPEIQASMGADLMSDMAIFNANSVPSLEVTSIESKSIDAIISSKNQDSKIDQEAKRLFNHDFSDQASDSDESLILLTNKNVSNNEFTEWEDSLINELNSDLERLDFGISADPSIANSLDQFIRNTPYALTNWDAKESQSYPTIIDINADTLTGANLQEKSIDNISNVIPIIENPDNLFVDKLGESLDSKQNKSQLKPSNEQSEVVIDIADLQPSPFSTKSNEIPEIFDEPESLFEPKIAPQGSGSEHDSDDMDAIFADVIAANAAKYSSSTPFESNDELDQLFVESVEKTSPKNIELIEEIDESELDTLLFGFDPNTEIEHVFVNNFDDPSIPTNAKKLNEFDTVMQDWQDHGYSNLDVGANTMKESLTFSEPIEVIEELDTILQGFAESEAFSLNTSTDITNFVAIEDVATVIEDPDIENRNNNNIIIINVNQADEWSFALEQLEAELIQPVIEYRDKSEIGELSADEFFAALEHGKLNDFADAKEKPDISSYLSKLPNNAIADFIDLDDQSSSEDEDSLLNEFADSQNNFEGNDWDNLLDDLNSFNFSEPLLDDRREQLGLSSVAPITDTLDNVLDIDSFVMESRSVALVPPPPEKELYSLDHTWILGIDIGSTAIRTSLLNANTGKVYSLSLDDANEMLCKLVWNEDHSLDDPIAKEIRTLIKKSQNIGLEDGEVAITHFKQFLKLGLPYRGVSTWQPIVQWTDGHQASLRWLISALKNLLEQIQTRANHPKLPDLGLILLKLSGVVFGYPTNWSDTYILNVREAILKSGLVSQAEQVMAVEQAIAPVLSLIHDHKLSQEITLLIDAGAVTTSLCLIKGVLDIKASDRSKVHIKNLDYAGISLSQDIIVQLFYPHWQLITNPNRHLCNFDHLNLPDVATDAPQQRSLLQQYLLSSTIGQQMLELADRVKITFGKDIQIDSWNEELMGQPIVVIRREIENLILQPFIQRINRELNAVISNAGILGEDIQQVLLLGSTMHIPLLSRWLTQKLPNAKIDPLSMSVVANGLAAAPLYPHLYDVARQQYSDYFLLQEICRLNLTQAINSTQLLKQLQMRGVNIKVCRDRILSILQGDLPEGLFPWQEPEHGVILEDPTISNDLFTGRLFDLETDGTYQPNITKFQQLRFYLQAIISNMSQTLNEPLVFPEVHSH